MSSSPEPAHGPHPYLPTALSMVSLLLSLLLLSFPGAAFSVQASEADREGGDDDTPANTTGQEGAQDHESEYEYYYRQSREKLPQPLNLGVTMVALVPLTLAAMAYKRTHNDRFLLLSGAFGLFAAKGMALSQEHRLGGYGLAAEDMEFGAVIIDLAIIMLIGLTMLRK